MNKNKILSLLLLVFLIPSQSYAQQRLVFSNETPEWDGAEFIIDIADETNDIDLKFAQSEDARIRFDRVADNFLVNRSIDLEGNQLVNTELENLGSAPTCDGTSVGRIYYDTGTDEQFVCDGAVWQQLLNEVVDDATPQLGGDLDVNGNSIVSVSNGDIDINPDGTGDITLGGDVLVGGASETIDSDGGAFLLDGDDVFIADSLGVEGAIYTDDTGTKYNWIDIFGCIRGSATTGTIAGGRSAVVRFDQANDSQMRCSVPVPDDWQSGTDINFDIFWSPSDNGSGGLHFDWDYGVFGLTDNIAAGTFTDTTITTESVASTTQTDLYSFTASIPNASIGADEMINFRLQRSPGQAADTY